MNRGLLASGAIAVLIGCVVIIDPGVIGGFSLPSEFITAVGLLALIEALRAGYSRFSRSVDTPDLPEPERRQVASVPGTEFDEQIASVTRRSKVGSVRDRDRIRDQLTETAIEVLVRYDGDTPDRARERLRTGSWTDDHTAAYFFVPASEIQTSVTEWIGRTVTGDAAFRQRARRAVIALTDRIDVEGTDER
jgi:hypothetical protein